MTYLDERFYAFSKIFQFELTNSGRLEILEEFVKDSDIEHLWTKEWTRLSASILSNDRWFEIYTTFFPTNSTETDNLDLSTDSYLQDTKFDWTILWDDYVTRIHEKYYNSFALVYHLYRQDLELSLEEIETTEETKTFKTTHDCTEDFEAMKILGLPTSFGDTAEMGKTNLNTVNPSEKKKKLNRRLRKVPEFLRNDSNLLKYWKKRFSLFSRFDEGITLDQESWFSVTPEKIACHMAERLSCDLIIDGFCGCGGNTIQFAKHCRRVIAIDIDEKKIQMARENAAIYGVADKIEFIVGDFVQLSLTGKLFADAVFLSPPWGGPRYKKAKSYDIEKSLLPISATKLIECAGKISENIALFLPRNSNLQQVIKLAGVGKKCEVEHNYLNERLVGITAFYGETVKV